MSIFEHYARYYDLVYKDKDYCGEATFVSSLVKEYNPAASRVLELGCGTGKHAIEFGKLGYSVKGYDISNAMVAEAKSKITSINNSLDISFDVGDVTKLRDPHKYDVVLSLFHVVNYQTEFDSLIKQFETAAVHLLPGGLFLFDYWYGPAVLLDPPMVRIKRLSDEKIDVIRIAEPDWDTEQDQVTVNYHVLIKDKETGTVEEVKESHKVRYLFLPAMRHFLCGVGFKLLKVGPWLERGSLTNQNWYGYIVAQKC